MYEIKDNTLCIPAKALYEDWNAISFDLYKNTDFRKKLNFIQKGGNGRKALVAFESLPADVKNKVIDVIGTPTKEDRKSRIEFFYQEDIAARSFFEEYILPDGRHLEPQHQDEYTANASMLAAIDAVISETLIIRKSRGGGKGVNWDGITEMVMDAKRKKAGEDYPYFHTLPPSRLRKVYNAFKKEDYISLISGKIMLKNRAKIDSEVKEALLTELLGNGRNIDNVLIADLYNAIARAKEWKEITASTVSVWRKKLKRVTEAGRRGSKHYKNTLSMQVKRSRPSAPLFYWTADGWKAELFFQKFKNGTTTYHHRHTIVVILDAFNNYPIGYAIGENESPELIKEALKDAAIFTPLIK